MSSLLGLLRLGYGGVQAQRSLTEIAGQNIANAGVPGYRRQSAVLSTLPGANAAGVRVGGFQQARDAFLARQMGASLGTLGHEQALRQSIETTATYFDEVEGAGLGNALDRFFGAVGRVTQDPGSPENRQEVLATGQALASRVRQAAGALAQAQQAADADIDTSVTGINDGLARVASLNRQISAREASGGNAGTMRDERDRILQGLAETLGTSAVEATDGTVTVVTASGEAIVQGDVAGTLSATTGPAGRVIQVSWGQQAPIDLSQPVGGRLGGLLEARDTTLVSAAEALDRFAFEFAGAFNAIHEAGTGADGVSGRNFFDPLTSQSGAAGSLRVVLAEPSEFAAASNPGELPGGNSVAQLLFDLASDDGFGSVPGRPASLLAAPGNLLARRFADARAAEEAESVVLAQVEALHASRTGVSVEEELVNVTAAQRALEASAKTVKAADEMLQAVLSLV